MSDTGPLEAEITLTGTLFAGAFDVVDRIGEGAMGNVYRARYLPTGEWVALKRLHPEHAKDAEVNARFDREMEATESITHPNTAKVIAHGEHEGALYLAMELIEGRALDDVIVDDAPMSSERAAHIGAQIASALGAAHDLGFVHRDLKPENILLTQQGDDPDFVKVLDFGLAAMVENPNHSRLTAQGLRVGTPLFMAPEYIAGSPSDHRVDLYGLGVVLYMLVVGKAPFLGSGYKLLNLAVSESPTPPSETAAGCEPWLDAIILRLMEKDPERRIQSAEEVERLLRKRQQVTVFPAEDRVQAPQNSSNSASSAKASDDPNAGIRRWLGMIAVLILFVGGIFFGVGVIGPMLFAP